MAARSLTRAVAPRLPTPARNALRPLARRVGLAAPADAWWQQARPPWAMPSAAERRAGAWCNVCGWSGSAFLGFSHTESATCPRCGAIARDRFLLWCFTRRTPRPWGLRLLETSPRLGGEYREMMRRWCSYRASDFDLGAHRADVQIDLQDIALPAAAVDVVLTPHVLEHVPDTDRALAELHRVIAPGGRMYLQVPLLQGRTAAPAIPEFHADDTPVHWRFGWDLTDRLRSAGFTTTVLVTAEYAAMLRGDRRAPAPCGDGFDLDTLVPHPRPTDLVEVADGTWSTLLGFEPAWHFATWECLRA
jgi:hypothetical protein